MITADGFRRALEHERIAQEAVLASMDTVPPERQDDAAFRTARDWFAHIIAARELWLHRIGGLEQPPRDAELEGLSIHELRERAAGIQARWEMWAQELLDDDMTDPVEYAGAEGTRWRATLGETLLHVYTHGFHHRGQINSLIAACGGTPASIGLMFSVRERLDG